ncbi:hypothetical protein RP20_CCG005995 [Aedes albopictus]|nr:hypothetical protein RP20_CCG005995 [Aedes albopictus]
MHCSREVCMGSVMLPNIVGTEPRKSDIVLQHAKEFLDQYYSSIRRQAAFPAGTSSSVVPFPLHTVGHPRRRIFSSSDFPFLFIRCQIFLSRDSLSTFWETVVAERDDNRCAGWLLGRSSIHVSSTQSSSTKHKHQFSPQLKVQHFKKSNLS